MKNCTILNFMKILNDENLTILEQINNLLYNLEMTLRVHKLIAKIKLKN
jgi:hypothetical protein